MLTFGLMLLERGMNTFITPAMGYLVPQLFFYKEGFGIKYPRKVDMPLNKQTKSISKTFLQWCWSEPISKATNYVVDFCITTFFKHITLKVIADTKFLAEFKTTNYLFFLIPWNCLNSNQIRNDFFPLIIDKTKLQISNGVLKLCGNYF